MENLAFTYKNGNSFFHKMPAVIKIILLPALNILFLLLPLKFALSLLSVQFLLSCFLHFTLKEQLQDFKPVIFYAILLYLFNFICNFCSLFFTQDNFALSLLAVTPKSVPVFFPASFEFCPAKLTSMPSGNFALSPLAVTPNSNPGFFPASFDFCFAKLTSTPSGNFALSLLSALQRSFFITFSNKETFSLLVKLFCIIQCTSLIFKTSTTLQIRQAIEQIETFFRKILPVSKKNKFTNLISLFICFIPLVYKNWFQCKRAWIARGGKKGIKMYLVMLPVFFSVGIKQAWITSRAMEIRGA